MLRLAALTWYLQVCVSVWLTLCSLGSTATEQLNPETFALALDSGRNGMVRFYQPWCGRSKRIQPDWELLAQHADESVFIADVNCQEESSLCSEYHTGGSYPTILVFRPGQPPKLYQDGLGFEDLMRYVDKEIVTPCWGDHAITSCTEKQQRYLDKWQSVSLSELQQQMKRLKAMDVSTLSFELERWRNQRIQIISFLIDKRKNEEHEL
eukprot:Nitzschia sp. Nitz4//scaffold196_size54656//15807//16572//NITZ4_006636-RA/size54656-snap-gene-0.25-mRNA-1//1//CDS//3329540417//6681//frame0